MTDQRSSTGHTYVYFCSCGREFKNSGAALRHSIKQGHGKIKQKVVA